MVLNRLMKARSGQVMVLVAVLLIGLVAMLALVLDGSNAYLQRRRLYPFAVYCAVAGVVCLFVALFRSG